MKAIVASVLLTILVMMFIRKVARCLTDWRVKR